MKLILASASPRRQELLHLLTVPFAVVPVDIDETPEADEPAVAYVERLAIEKARAAQQQVGAPPATWVLGSDTTVVADADILGKPTDQADAARMLRRLSGRAHEVMTAVALCGPDGLVQHCRVDTRVWFRTLADQDIAAYWATGEPADKAGAYGIQGLGGRFVERLDGSYHAVMGLPLEQTGELLRRAGFDLWSGAVRVSSDSKTGNRTA
ncbi:septum formation inhibitor Maf [Natronospirillum operosum]|uniref:dTTP/UTP pyrophosphatase n=1 Tax=Natronospirillum operosum TaxID=2759953 RepID=A0A4Z0W9L2_9GAMM|nr:Maf family protein [Natronospirillum operosum]TGG95309.1 septum formation inhibitor Maf [Natronospirillum operosum]